MVVSTGSGIRDVFSRVSHGNAGSGAWLLLSTDVRQHGGNDGYADEIGSSYKWDSTVPNHRGIAVGDLVLLWDKVQLLGASVVAGISTGTKVKNRHRCPTCRSTKIKRRANALPDGSYRCHGCRTSFFEPDTEAILVDTFETDHRAGWTDLRGTVSGDRLRASCLQPKSQHSLRPMEPKVAARIVAEASSEQTLRLLQRLQDPAWGGRRSSVVRVRVGQDRFRRELLRRYGNECAVTGQGPPEALEAAHLYRFSAAGRHYKDGGLLLRRDVHTLFDRGALLIEPEALRVVIGPPLDGYPQYASLAGKPVTVPLTDRQKAWIERHWRQFREPR